MYTEYRKERNVKGVQVATGGFRFALDVLASGLCRRIDLYGWAALLAGSADEVFDLPSIAQARA